MSEWSDWKLPDQVPINIAGNRGEASAHTATITNSNVMGQEQCSHHGISPSSIWVVGEQSKKLGLKLLVPAVRNRTETKLQSPDMPLAASLLYRPRFLAGKGN
jgi:hypothetical protein